MNKYLRYAALPALFAAPAFAGNLQEPVVEPVIAAPVQVQPISDWTGFYLGAQAGYGRTSSLSYDGESIDDFPELGDTTTVDGFSLKPSGGLGGIHAGYMHDMGQWVLGGELDYDWADISDSADVGVALNGEPVGSAKAELELKNVARAKLIAGYDLGNGLVYGTVGAFRAKAEATVSDGFASLSGSETDNGWLAGIGYKHKFTENWIGGVEALYHKADDFGDTDLDLKLTTITARISYKF